MGCLEGEKGLGTTAHWPVMSTTSLTSLCLHLNISRDSKLTVLVGWTALVVRNCFPVLTERGREMRSCLIIYAYCPLLCSLKKHLASLLSDTTTLQHERWHPRLSMSPSLQEKHITFSDFWGERVSRSSAPGHSLVNKLQILHIPPNCTPMFEESPRGGLTRAEGALIQLM